MESGQEASTQSTSEASAKSEEAVKIGDSVSEERPRIIKRGSLTKRPRKKYDPLFYVNSLAAIACILGVISLMLPWVHGETSSDDDYFGLAHYANDRDLRYGLAIGLLVVGSFFVLFVRVLGVVQLAGVLLFLSAARDDFSGHSLGYTFGAMSTGFYAGIVAGVLGTTSIILKPIIPVSERYITIVTSRNGRTHRVNFLSLAAAVLGLICIFLPWLMESITMRYSDLSWNYSFSLFASFSLDWGPYMMTATALFLFGSVVALISPLGGFSQLVGALLYARGVILDFHDFHSAHYGDGTIALGIGFYLGLIAALAALVSIWYTRRLLVPVSLFSFRVNERAQPSLASLEAPASEVKPLRLPWTIRRASRVAFVCVIFFVLISVPLIIAYVAPVTKLNIEIDNYDQELAGEAVVYVDGEPVWSASVPAGSQLTRSMRIASGVHNIALDEAIPGRTLASAPDGRIDWSTSVRVRPLISVTVVADIGYFGWSRPNGNISLSQDSTGVTVTFEGFTQILYGQVFTASISWYDVTILLTDGISGVSWSNMTPLDFVGHTPPVTWHYGQPEILGTLEVWLNVTDLGANNDANRGDYFTLQAGNSAFDPAADYTVYILYQGGDVICSADF